MTHPSYWFFVGVRRYGNKKKGIAMAGSDRGACRLGCREKEVAEKTSFEKEARIYLRI